jgi:translation initiation factor IF-2
MTKRLVKIAKELNVGTSTIVEFLNDNGYDIENKPTAKVSEPMYDALLKEFQKSIDIKEKAAQINIGVRAKKEEETVAKKEAAPQPIESEKKPPANSASPESKNEETAPPKKEEPKKEEPAPEAKKEEEETKTGPKLKVLGKIDLSESASKRGKKKAKDSEPKKEAEETPAPEAKKEEKKEEEPQQKQEEKPAAKEEPAKKEEAPEKKEEAKPASEPKKEEAAKPKEQPAAKSEPKQEEPKKEEPVEKPETPAEEEAPKKEGVIRANAPELRGLKVLGKIDTDKFKKPKKKKKKEEAKPDAKKTDKGKDANDDNTRRRRRRKRVTVDNRRSGGGSGGGGRGRGGRDNKGGGRGKKRDEIKEVSQKEIDEKIKATMARLSGGNKKKRQRFQRDKRARIREKEEQEQLEQETGKLELTEFISVQELANLMDVDATEVIMTCMNLGIMVSINQRLDAEIIELVTEEFGHEVEFISAEEQIMGEEIEEEEDDPADLKPRAPVVTVMGHVDHGKTSLLDFIREASVASGEAGGITQHVGAYEVQKNGQKITFLDTPGHEAFTAMRARGAKVTDIAIIIIAADDNIMPQTKEAISHAQAAGVPMVFAINKIDKPGAQPERIKQELANMNLLLEEWGGKYQSQDISAKEGTGVDELLEKVLLEAEILELQANPDRLASGAIVEASIEKGRGYVAKMLVQNGTLRIGDPMVAGEYSGKVKAMLNETGSPLKHAGPAQPVLVLGLDGAPQAGEVFKVVESEQEARQIASKRAQIMREQSNRATKRISLDEIGRRLALGTFKELNLIVKGDVDGSVEALADSLIKLSIETVQVNVIHKAVGAIAESDVLLASASDAIIIGFQVRPSLGARKLAEREGVQIKMYSIIYEAIEEIKMAIEGMLEPTKEEKIQAEVEVREIFKISKVGTIAGCFVRDGKINRNHHIRLVRDGIVVYPTKEGQHGEIDSLKRFKDDVKEVRNGMECGISIKNFNDIKVGDVVESYEIIEVKQTYDS